MDAQADVLANLVVMFFMEKKMSFLIIDDNSSIHRLIARFLCNEKVSLKTALNAQEALCHLHEGIFKGVFLDLNLGTCYYDGINVLRNIRGGYK